MLKRTLLAASMSISAIASAEPFDAKRVPADAKWALHVDFDALMKTDIWPTIEQRINGNPNFSAKLTEIEMAAGCRLPDDMHGITVYGMGFDEADSAVILHVSNVNQQQLLDILQSSDNFTNKKYAGHEILSWDDKGKQRFGGFAGDRVLIAHTPEMAAKAFDAIDGKAGTLKEASAITRADSPGVVAVIASDAISELANRNRNNPFIKQISSAWFTLSDKDNKLILRGAMVTADARAAQQLKLAVQGLCAIGTILANADNPDPQVKAIAPLLPGITLNTEGNSVTAEWRAPIEHVKAAFEALQAAKANRRQSMSEPRAK